MTKPDELRKKIEEMVWKWHKDAPPQKPKPISTACPNCGSTEFNYDNFVDFHVCEKCGRHFI